MAGIASVIKLREAGIYDVTVFEKARDVGGTWRENTYPGIACDVPSHLYSYSFAPNAGWTHAFSPGDEIQAYFRDVARREGVRSEEHTSELQSLMRISYAVFCLNKKQRKQSDDINGHYP